MGGTYTNADQKGEIYCHETHTHDIYLLVCTWWILASIQALNRIDFSFLNDHRRLTMGFRFHGARRQKISLDQDEYPVVGWVHLTTGIFCLLIAYCQEQIEEQFEITNA